MPPLKAFGLERLRNRHERRQHAQNARRRGNRVDWLWRARGRDHLRRPSSAGFGRFQLRPPSRPPRRAIGESTATLSGTVNPNGQSTSYYFEYGTSTTYGTPDEPGQRGVGNDARRRPPGDLRAQPEHHLSLPAGGHEFGRHQQRRRSDADHAVDGHEPGGVLGHEGFVSPGWIVGAELGCFHGTTPCAGQLTMSHNGTTIAQRSYSIPLTAGASRTWS